MYLSTISKKHFLNHCLYLIITEYTMYIGCVKQGLILTCTTNCRLKQEDKFTAVMIDFTDLLGRLNMKDCILLNFKKNFQRRLFKEKLGSLFIAGK